jgi:putative copper resistance protein D
VNVFVLFIHITFACLWVGGMLFMVFVSSPYIRKTPFKDEAFQNIGKRFSLIGTQIGLPILLITGLLNMHFLGIPYEALIKPQSLYEKTLQIKFHTFLLVVIISVIHDFYISPKAKTSAKYGKIARVLGVLNLVFSLFIILFASALRYNM